MSTSRRNFTLDDHDIQERLEFLDISEEDQSRIRSISPYLRTVSKQVADIFYDKLQKVPELRGLLEGRIDRLKATQAAYFEDLLDGKIGPDYVASRVKVGQTHERVGLKPKWYLGAFNMYQQLTARMLRESSEMMKNPLAAWDAAMSLTKLVFFDMTVAIDTYIDAVMDTVRTQEAALRELSAPVIEVWDGVLVLPVIGTVDTRRAQEITESLLNTVVERRARVAIIDITGLPVMDTSTANHLFKAVRAVELLGTIPVVTGIRPAIAQTVINFGMDTSTLRTRARLVDGLKYALEIIGQTVVSEKNGHKSEAEAAVAAG